MQACCHDRWKISVPELKDPIRRRRDILAIWNGSFSHWGELRICGSIEGNIGYEAEVERDGMRRGVGDGDLLYGVVGGCNVCGCEGKERAIPSGVGAGRLDVTPLSGKRVLVGDGGEKR